jgi:16S rRNA (cytosine967-C5)-methyltransferase
VTPGARMAAAITLTDRILAGEAAEAALTNWARASRFAGSGDRAAVRDLVFDALRRQRSYSWLGGGLKGRAIHLGQLLAQGQDPAALFTGQGHAPAPLNGEGGQALDLAPGPVRADLPDWLWPDLRDLPADVLAAMSARAPVFLRVNCARTTPEAAIAALAAEGIGCAPVAGVPSALVVASGQRLVERSAPYVTGLVDLQDASSQAAMLALGPVTGLRVLDYCAGGGGKALALAEGGAIVTAHDANPARMRDIPARAARAGVNVAMTTTPEGTFPLVLVDAPCSGSGTWRRAPDAKWRLTPTALDRLVALQGEILDRAAAHVAPGGRLAFATCSLLAAENEGSVAAFLARAPAWQMRLSRSWLPSDQGDGFFLAVLSRN